MESAIPTFTPPRVPLDVEVDCGTDQVNGTLNYQTMNVSEGGIFLKTSFPLEVGTRLAVRFHLPDGGKRVEVEGEVGWVRTGPPENVPPPGMGVRFLSLMPEDRGRIQQYAAAYEEEGEPVHDLPDSDTASDSDPACDSGRASDASESLAPGGLSESLRGRQIGLRMEGMAASVEAEVRAVSASGLAVAVQIPCPAPGAVIELEGVDPQQTKTLKAEVLWSEVEAGAEGRPQLHMGLKLAGSASAEVPAAEVLPPPPAEVSPPGFHKDPPPPVDFVGHMSKLPQAMPSEVSELFGPAVTPPPPGVAPAVSMPNVSGAEKTRGAGAAGKMVGAGAAYSFASEVCIDPPPPEPPTPWRAKPRLRDYSNTSCRPVSRRGQSKQVSRTFITVVSCLALAGLGAAFAVVLSWSRAERKKTGTRHAARPTASAVPTAPGNEMAPNRIPASGATAPASPAEVNVAAVQPSGPGTAVAPPPNSAEPSPVEAAAGAGPAGPAHGTANIPGTAPPAGSVAATLETRIKAWTRGRDFVIKLAAGASPKKVSHYWMLKPPALVVDLHGVRPQVRPGRYKVSHGSVRFVRVVRVKGRARFIVYFEQNRVPSEVAVQKNDGGGTLTLVAAGPAVRRATGRRKAPRVAGKPVAARKFAAKRAAKGHAAARSPKQTAKTRTVSGKSPAKKTAGTPRLGFINRKPGATRGRGRKPQPRLTLAE